MQADPPVYHLFVRPWNSSMNLYWSWKAVLPCPTVSIEINPLLFQTLGKWHAANVSELSALTNVFSLLEFTEVEDRKDILSSKEPHRLRDLYFVDMSAFGLLNMKNCALSLPTNHHLLCISKCSQLLFPLGDLIKVQACPPPTLQKARAGPSALS